MKNTLYILLPLAVVSLIVGMVLKWGLNPRPVAVMKPSFFDEPAELGSVVYRRFFVELQDSPVVVWGADAQSTEHLEVVAGFLAEGEPRKVFVDEELTWSRGPRFPEARVLDFQSQYEELKQEVEAAVEGQGQVLLITKYAFSAQKVGMNTLSKDLKKDLERPLFTVTHLPLAVTADQEAELHPKCQVVADKGPAELGCLALAKSRSIYRKSAKFPSEKWVAVLDRWPGNDLFIYWRYLP